MKKRNCLFLLLLSILLIRTNTVYAFKTDADYSVSHTDGSSYEYGDDSGFTQNSKHYTITDGSGNSYTAYCINPKLSSPSKVKVIYTLVEDAESKKQKAIDYGALVIMADTSADLDTKEFALRAYFNGVNRAYVYKKGKYNNIITTGTYAGQQYGSDTIVIDGKSTSVNRHDYRRTFFAYINLAYDWVKDSSELQTYYNAITKKNKNYNYIYTYYNVTIGSDEFNKWRGYTFDSENSTIKNAKSLFTKGLKAAYEYYTDETSDQKIEVTKTDVTWSDDTVVSDDVSTKYVVVKIEPKNVEEWHLTGVEANNVTVTLIGGSKNISTKISDYKSNFQSTHKDGVGYYLYKVTRNCSDDSKAKLKASFQVKYSYKTKTALNGVLLEQAAANKAPTDEEIATAAAEGKYLPLGKTSYQRFLAIETIEGSSKEGKSKKIKVELTCDVVNPCDPNVTIPQLCSDNSTPDENHMINTSYREGVIDGDTAIQQCIIDKSDYAGNNFLFDSEEISKNNAYCKVYCKEDFDFHLPYKAHTYSGRYFRIGMSIEGQQYCYSTEINYEQYKTDMNAASRTLRANRDAALKDWEIAYKVKTTGSVTTSGASYKDGDLVVSNKKVCYSYRFTIDPTTGNETYEAYDPVTVYNSASYKYTEEYYNATPENEIFTGSVNCTSPDGEYRYYSMANGSTYKDLSDCQETYIEADKSATKDARDAYKEEHKEDIERARQAEKDAIEAENEEHKDDKDYKKKLFNEKDFMEKWEAENLTSITGKYEASCDHKESSLYGSYDSVSKFVNDAMRDGNEDGVKGSCSKSGPDINGNYTAYCYFGYKNGAGEYFSSESACVSSRGCYKRYTSTGKSYKKETTKDYKYAFNEAKNEATTKYKYTDVPALNNAINNLHKIDSSFDACYSWTADYDLTAEVKYSYDEPINSTSKWVNEYNNTMTVNNKKLVYSDCEEDPTSTAKCVTDSPQKNLDGKTTDLAMYCNNKPGYDDYACNSHDTSKQSSKLTRVNTWTDCNAKATSGAFPYECEKEKTYKKYTYEYIVKYAYGSAEYDTPRVFFIGHPGGVVKVGRVGDTAPAGYDIVDGLPIGTNTPIGTYYYKLSINNLGRFFDDKGQYGRVFGENTNSVINAYRDGNLDAPKADNGVTQTIKPNEYACTYTVDENVCEDPEGNLIDWSLECEKDETPEHCKNRVCAHQTYCVREAEGYYVCDSPGYNPDTCELYPSKDEALTAAGGNDYNCGCPDCPIVCIPVCRFAELVDDTIVDNIVIRNVTPAQLFPNEREVGYNWSISASNSLVASKAFNTITEIQNRANANVNNEESIRDVSDYDFKVTLSPNVASWVKRYKKNYDESGSYSSQTLYCIDYDLTQYKRTEEDCIKAGYKWKVSADGVNGTCVMQNIFCYSSFIDSLIEQNPNAVPGNIVEKRNNSKSDAKFNSAYVSRYGSSLEKEDANIVTNDYWTIYIYSDLDINGDGIPDIGPSWK